MFDIIQQDFKFNIKDRLHIASESKMYRIGEDQQLWQDAKLGNFKYQVYWDGEFVCFFDVTMSKQVLYLDFWKGFQRLYEEKKIFINKKMYDIQEEQRKAKEKALEEEKTKALPVAKTKEEKMVVEAIKRAKNEGKRKGKKLIIPTKT